MMNIFKYIPQKLAIDTSKATTWFDDMKDAATTILEHAGQAASLVAAGVLVVALIFQIVKFVDLKKNSHGDEIPKLVLSIGLNLVAIVMLLSFGLTGWGLL